MVDRGVALRGRGLTGSPTSTTPRRVLLFDYHVERALVDELAANGCEVVATVIGRVDGVPHVALEELLDGTPHAEAPRTSVVDPQPTLAELALYARCASRLGRVPFTRDITLDLGGGIALDELEASARLHIGRCLDLLQLHRVEEVWFTSVPHFGLDQALAIAARIQQLPVLVTRQLPFPAKFTWEWWIDGEVSERPRPDDFSRWDRGAVPLDLFYMVPRRWERTWVAMARRVRGILHALVRLRWRELGARAWRAAIDRRWWRLASGIEGLDPMTRAMASRHRLALAEASRARSRRRFDDPERVTAPFVFFSLHYEPEANADVYGGEFAFQPAALSALSAAMPEGWRILVKENPAQGFVRRGEAFHRLIESLPNVWWVPDDTPSATLVARSALVASLCGTVGYEALLAGKPCLYFGHPWYATLPGAIRFRPAIDLAALAAVEIDRVALDEAVDALVGSAADGIATRRFSALVPDVGESEAMCRLTARSLARISRAARDGLG